MISNEFIRQATEEYLEESMPAIPTENEIDHVFSDRFEKKTCFFFCIKHDTLRFINDLLPKIIAFWDLCQVILI